MEPIYFTKVQFCEGRLYGKHSIMLLNLEERELSYQVFEKTRNVPVIQGVETVELSGEIMSFDISKAVRIVKTPSKRELIPIDQTEDKVVFSYGIKLTDKQYNELLPYCNACEFEPFRSKKMSINDEGFIGYRDEINVYFTGVTDSYIPIMEWDMSYYYDEKHIWPSEKLYRYLVKTFF